MVDESDAEGGELEYEVDYEPPEPDEPAENGSEKSFLEYAKALGPPFAASVTALTIALIGFFGNRALKEHDKTNLYADLISRREEAESGLRKDMFQSMTEQFFGSHVAEGRVDYSKRLLQLEMLALNFGESITMGPLFHELSSEIRGAYEAREISFVDRQLWLHRLEKLARKVASWQLAALNRPNSEEPHAFEFVVHPAEWRNGRFSWPKEVDRAAERGFEESFGEAGAESFEGSFGEAGAASFEDSFGEAGAASFEESFGEGPAGDDSGPGIEPGADDGLDNPMPELDPLEVLPLDPDDGSPDAARWQSLLLDGVERNVRLLLFDPDYDAKAVRAKVFIEGTGDFEFNLDFFDFPMIDSIRLSHGHRLALVLNAFDEDKTQVTCVLFHSMYGSQRDKPFLDVVIDQMPRVVNGE